MYARLSECVADSKKDADTKRLQELCDSRKKHQQNKSEMGLKYARSSYGYPYDEKDESSRMGSETALKCIMVEIREISHRRALNNNEFYKQLVDDPKELLIGLIKHARECMDTFEHANPINRSKEVRLLLAEFERSTHNILENLKLDRSSQERKASTYEDFRFQFIYLFHFFKRAVKIKIPAFAEKINASFVETINACCQYRGADINFFHPSEFPSYLDKANVEDEKTASTIEQGKYERALSRFKEALDLYPGLEHTNEYKTLNKLTDLNGDSKDPEQVNLCSLALNTAADRLLKPEPLYQQRLDALGKLRLNEQPSIKVADACQTIRIIGLIIAVVGIAILLWPALPTIIGAAEAAKTAAVITSAAEAIKTAGVITFVAGSLIAGTSSFFQFRNKHTGISKKILDANQAADRLKAFGPSQ